MSGTASFISWPRLLTYHPSRVVAGLVPATPIVLALCLKVRGCRDKPGDEAGTCGNKRIPASWRGDLIIQVAPSRIHFSDEPCLPYSRPVLHVLLALDRR